MALIVVDASALGAVLLPDEGDGGRSLLTLLLAAEGFHTPAHWPLELAGMIWSATRRGRLDEEQKVHAMEQADAIVASATVHPLPAITALVPFASSRGLTVYDAAYLHLALGLGAKLVTLDAELRREAVKAGVPLIDFVP